MAADEQERADRIGLAQPERAAIREREARLAARRAAEAALRQSEERLQILFARAADAMYVSDLSGKLIQVNEQACLATGYTEAELLGMNVIEVDADTAAPEGLREFFSTLSPGRVAILSSQHRRKDGSLYPVEINLQLFDYGGEKLCMALVANLTEIKQLEEEKRRKEELCRLMLQGIPSPA